MLGKHDIHLALSFSHWRNCRPWDTPSMQHCADLGEEQCGQSETALLTLLMWFFWGFVVKGKLKSYPVSWELYKGILSMESC